MDQGSTMATGKNTAVPLFRLDPARQAWPRGINRLHLIPSNDQGGSGSLEQARDTTLHRLTAAGLAWRHVPGKAIHVQGGANRERGILAGP
jgi:hypothetical protein